MSLQPSSADVASAIKEDMEYVIKHSMKKGYQALSLITPPAYAAISLYRHGRRGFNVNKLLRATWMGGGIGIGLGGGAAWLRLRSQSPESVHDRRIRLMYNQSQKQADDYSAIGSILFAILTPSLLWNRAQVVNLILGGGGIGSGAGILAHLSRSISQGDDINPEGMIDVLQEDAKKA